MMINHDAADRFICVFFKHYPERKELSYSGDFPGGIKFEGQYDQAKETLDALVSLLPVNDKNDPLDPSERRLRYDNDHFRWEFDFTDPLLGLSRVCLRDMRFWDGGNLKGQS